MAEDGLRGLTAGPSGVVRDPGDLAARSGVLYGAWPAGTVFATAGSGLHHKICHVLGGAYELPHPRGRPAARDRARHVVAARRRRPRTGALGAPTDTPAANALAALARRLDAPTSLRAIGLAEDELPAAARLVGAHAPDRSPADIEALLSAAWRGEMPSTPVSAAAEHD